MILTKYGSEAFHYWTEGEPLVPEGALRKKHLESNYLIQKAGEPVGLIEEYLDMLLPEDWGNNGYLRQTRLCR